MARFLYAATVSAVVGYILGLGRDRGAGAGARNIPRSARLPVERTRPLTRLVDGARVCGRGFGCGLVNACVANGAVDGPALG